MSKKITSTCHSDNPDYSSQLPKLNRISGQVEGIKRMIEEGRYCPDILTQMRAARAALHAVEGAILEAHLGACVSDALAGGSKEERQKKIDELKKIFRQFQ